MGHFGGFGVFLMLFLSIDLIFYVETSVVANISDLIKLYTQLVIGWEFFSTMATIIDGKKISQDIQSELKEEVSEWIAKGNRKPHLTAVLVGEDPASEIYVRNKMTVSIHKH